MPEEAGCDIHASDEAKDFCSVIPEADVLGIRGEPERLLPSWHLVLTAFCMSQAVNEVMGVLDVLVDILESTPVSELEIYREEFAKGVDSKRASTPEIFVPIVDRMIASLVATYLKIEPTTAIYFTEHILQGVFSYISLAENSILCAVSHEWKDAAEAACLWRPAYECCFKKHQVADLTCDAKGIWESVWGNNGSRHNLKKRASYKEGFRRRLNDPEVEDQIEVSWRGKFRLESLEIYNGMAWWIAVVVGKDGEGQYQVHYPGWDSRWDEWVPRSRLRWGNRHKTRVLEGCEPCVGDEVEMWCGGVNVPGAWLEATVSSVQDSRLYLGGILTSGHFWVDANRVRVVKKGCVGGTQGKESFRRIEGEGRECVDFCVEDGLPPPMDSEKDACASLEALVGCTGCSPGGGGQGGCTVM